MRDARINTIGEGANDVLKAFIAVVGCRGPGEYLKGLRDDMLGGAVELLRKMPAALGVGAKLVGPVADDRHADRAGEVAASCATTPTRWRSCVREFGLKLPHVFMAAEGRGDVRAGASWSTSASRTSPSTCTCRACVLARLDHCCAGRRATARRPRPTRTPT